MKYDRLQQIKKLLLQRRKVTNVELCDTFNVSIETIRRDLNQLEREGIINKVYGGAVLAEKNQLQEPIESWTVRMDENRNAKRAIARATAAMVPHDCTVYLDSGTSALEVAHFLKEKKNLTVVTNSPYIAIALGTCENLIVYNVGGLVNTDTLAAVGFLASEFISFFSHFDFAVVSSDGFVLGEGATDHVMESAMLKKSILEKAENILLAIDHTKFNQRAKCVTCQTERISALITDSGVAPDVLANLRLGGVNVVVADVEDEGGVLA